MRYDKVKYGEYLMTKVREKFPEIRELGYDIEPDTIGVSLYFEHGSVHTKELNSFMTWLRFNDPIVIEAIRLDKEEYNEKIETSGYIGLVLLVAFTLIILTILIYM